MRLRPIRVDDSLAKAIYTAAESVSKSQNKDLAPLLLFAAKTLYLSNTAVMKSVKISLTDLGHPVPGLKIAASSLYGLFVHVF